MWEREDYSKANIESKLKFADGIYFNLKAGSSASACNRKEVTDLSPRSCPCCPMIPSIKQDQSVK